MRALAAIFLLAACTHDWGKYDVGEGGAPGGGGEGGSAPGPCGPICEDRATTCGADDGCAEECADFFDVCSDNVATRGCVIAAECGEPFYTSCQPICGS
jgi:hypothetical protein